MYRILDNLKDLGLELELPFEIFSATCTPKAEEQAEEKEPVDHSAYVFNKDFECPICRAKFVFSVVRSSKLRMSHMNELRPSYHDIEPLYYDVRMCVACGYAALKDRFDRVSDKQKEALLANIRTNYLNFMPASIPDTIDGKLAAELFKYALLSAFVKKTTTGEKAMLLIKLSWIYQDLEDEENYNLYGKYAYEFLTEAYTTESFPILGMGQGAATYILARYATHFKDYSAALKFLSDVIIDRGLPTRLRDLARDMKDEILELRKEDE